MSRNTTLTIASLCLFLSLFAGCVVPADTALATNSEAPPSYETKASPEETQEAVPSKQASESVVADNRTAPNEPAPEVQPPPASKDEVSENVTSPRSLPETPPDLGMKFDVGEGVAEKDLAPIRQGFLKGQNFLDENLGGGISLEVRHGITVKVVATGRGNEEHGGRGACCTALSMDASPPGGPRPFFDTEHSDWAHPWPGWSVEAQQQKAAVHEFDGHGWQSDLGCLNMTWQPLGMWLNEGIAETIAYYTMIADGAFTKEAVFNFMRQSAIYTGEWEVPLVSLSETQAPVWPGHIGYLAVNVLLEGAPELDLQPASNGLMALRNICVEVAHGSTREAAFEITFGVSLPEFHLKFERWKATHLP